MTPSDITLMAFALVAAGALIGGGMCVAAGIIAEPLDRIAKALTPCDFSTMTVEPFQARTEPPIDPAVSRAELDEIMDNARAYAQATRRSNRKP